jgi:alkanesulfonate monooxygenase SsuD/methylene tetrahydromethanopterin reductase-like flavin-dependent oxidoreductase (luciferase family)
MVRRMQSRPLLFGLGIPAAADPDSDPVGAALMAEGLGFDFVSAADHPCGDRPSYETWTMLCWIAAATSRIRIATRVLGVPYRNPAMTAKMAETFDRLSRGRLILGLGAGYSDDEFRAFGLAVNSPGEKVRGLEEAVQITRGLWTQPEFTFAGSIHRTDRAPMEPKPDHAIPIWLGTFGPRALAVTGRLADGWIPSLGYAPDERLSAMRARVLDAAESAGRDPASITCALNLQARIDDRGDPHADDALRGPVDAVVERLCGFVERGFTAFNFLLGGADRDEQVARLAREVLPAVRAAAAR